MPAVTSNGYTVGKVPERKIHVDNDFPFGSKKGQATPTDHANWWKWEGVLRGGEAAPPPPRGGPLLFLNISETGLALQ